MEGLAKFAHEVDTVSEEACFLPLVVRMIERPLWSCMLHCLT